MQVSSRKTESGQSGNTTKEKIKIAFLLPTLAVGGAEKHVIEVVARLDRTHFLPTLYCISGGGELERDAIQKGIRLTIYQAHPAPQRRIARLSAICRYLRQERPDIAHCYLYPAQIWGGIAARLTGVPILMTSRRVLGEFKQRKPYLQWIENWVNRFTDVVIVNSYAVRDDALRRERIPDQKVRMVHNGVDTRKFVPQAELSAEQRFAKRRELGIPQDAPAIGMVANLIPYKGYREFIMAAADVQRDYPEARFFCIGQDRGIQAELAQLAQSLGIRHCYFTGISLDILEWFALLDIYVSASYEEAFSNALLEAMASGVPVIATEVGGTPEVVRHHQTGVLIPPKDASALAHAISTLLSHPEMARRLATNARMNIEKHFSIECMVTNMEKIYWEHIEQWRRLL